MPAPQNLKNHARFDPLWHFFVAPMLLVNFAFAITATVRHWPDHRSPLSLVDRHVHRALRRRRQSARPFPHRTGPHHPPRRAPPLCRPASRRRAPRTQSLTVKQIIALRFASDAELPALVHRTLTKTSPQSRSSNPSQTGARDYLRVSVDVPLIPPLLLHRRQILPRLLRRALRPFRNRIRAAPAPPTSPSASHRRRHRSTPHAPATHTARVACSAMRSCT